MATQIVICYGGWFMAGWDVLHIARSVDEIALGLPVSDKAYYDACPNNLFLTGLQGILTRCAALLGITDKAYAITVMGSCICVAVSVCLSAVAARQLVRSVWVGYACLLLGGGFVGLSPWVLVPYSDTYGMLCPALALCLYACMRDRPLKWFWVVGVCLVGTWIKPTAILFWRRSCWCTPRYTFAGKSPFAFAGKGWPCARGRRRWRAFWRWGSKPG